MFSLDNRLTDDTILVGDLHLCRVLLMNDRQFPWLILVPRVEAVTELHQLNSEQRVQLWQESYETSQAMMRFYQPDKLNVAALGNVVSQLHVHHVARFYEDVAWPDPVWGKHPAVPYDAKDAQKTVLSLRELLDFQNM